MAEKLRSIIIDDIFPTKSQIINNLGNGAWKHIGKLGGIKEVGVKLGCKSSKGFIITSDGHFVLSSHEFLFDEFLYSRGIEHTVGDVIPGSKYQCDFKIGNKYFEIWGYNKNNKGKIAEFYLKRREMKEKFYSDQEINYVGIEASVFSKKLPEVEKTLEEIMIKFGYDTSIKIDDFKFSDLYGRCSIWTKEKIIDSLSLWKNTNGFFPTKKQLKEDGQHDLAYAITEGGAGGMRYFKSLFQDM